jgi:hypothetical protein
MSGSCAFRADEGAGREAAVGEMIEEHLVRHQLGDRHHSPAGEGHQPGAEFRHVGNAAFRELQVLQGALEFVAGAAP